MLGTADTHRIGLPFSAELKRQMASMSLDSARKIFCIVTVPMRLAL